MPADLHIHTFFSDGTQSPEEIVELAGKTGLTAIAITDHDVVSGIERAKQKGREISVDVIPGIELTTEAWDTEIHILGYYIDVNNRELLNTLAKMQKSREDRVFKICEKLAKLDIKLDPVQVFEIAGHKAAGRPHVARALIANGSIKTFKEAFNKYIGFNGPAYVSHYKLSPQEAVQLIVTAGGIPVFGHPAVSKCDEKIPELVKAGLRGLEAHYGGHGQAQTQHYLSLAEKYGLLVTGGSDYHGAVSGREIKLGEFSIPDELIGKLQDEHLRGNRS